METLQQVLAVFDNPGNGFPRVVWYLGDVSGTAVGNYKR